jgi:multidrug transporter EmrE-like cation transporter
MNSASQTQPQLNPPNPEPAPFAQFWNLPLSILFRFVCCYFVLYAAPARERLSLISAIPGGSFLANSYLSLWQTLTPWVARTVFHLSGLALVYRRTGSTDTTLDYVQEFCFLILALATTVVWSILDRKRKHYGRLHAWLRLLVRYTLSFTLFTYGLVKIFPLQFKPTTLDRFVEPYGHFSPMGALWSFMSASIPYIVFAGLCEITPAVLLLFRRTTILGTLTAFGVLLNVVMLNVCYDVPVKLYSTNLLLMAIFLATPDVRRLTRVLLLDRRADPSSLPQIHFEMRWARMAATAFQIAFVGYFLFGQIKSNWTVYRSVYVHPDQLPIYGLYRVEAFQRSGREIPPLATDATRWDWVAAQNPQGLVVLAMDGSGAFYRARYDAPRNRVVLVIRGTSTRSCTLIPMRTICSSKGSSKPICSRSTSAEWTRPHFS